MTTAVTPEYLAASTVNTINAVMWIASSISLIFVALRVYVRACMKGTFGADDATVIVALALLIAYAAITTVATRSGLGRHVEFVEQNPDNLIKVALYADIGEALAIMACTLGKTSFAITLLRLIVQPWLKITLWFIIITMNTVNILAAIFVFAQCKDPRHLWNPTIPSQCWPTDVFTNYSLFVGAYSGAQDFLLALLPWAVVWKLQMQKREKLSIALAMSLGVFAGVTAIVKTTYLVALSKKSDYTWALAPLLWWAAAEDGLAIVASSIPTLRPLFKKVFPRSTRNESGSDKRNYSLKSVSNSMTMFTPSTKEENSSTVETRRLSSEGDDQSDRGILEQRDGDDKRRSNSWLVIRGQNTIRRTTEVNATCS